VRRRVLFPPYDLRASRASTTSAACSSSSTKSFTASGICPAGSKALRRFHLGEHPSFDADHPRRASRPSTSSSSDVTLINELSQTMCAHEGSRSWPKGPAVKTGIPTVASGFGLEELANTRASRRVELRPTRRGQNATVVR
jgi:hypothetical protein